ncbi:MAG: radical SAM protein [Bryobacterales bacterium]|nr:radical SAM protein [Bryobacteraceae bacterium]MDW8131372.1 radical SAM protein [Bryobacterales bacterium]
MFELALRRRTAAIRRRWREARLFAQAMTRPFAPIVAHLIPTRRCNLACTYCNEYDHRSEPVPLSELTARVDRLAELGASAVTLSGGEPLLHPEVEALVRHVRARGMLASLITNGYLLSPRLIEGLNRAGLDYLQISADNLEPDAVSHKSWRPLLPKLRWLARHATFAVNVNLVLGTGTARPEDAVTIAAEARRMGFHVTVGLAHDGWGRLRPLGARERAVYEQLAGARASSFADFATYHQFQRNLVAGRPNRWHCPAGGLYLYVCERGLVHYCSQQRGRPGIPLARYGVEDLEREYTREKPCAPLCTVSCVHQVAMLDRLRQQPLEALEEWFSDPGSGQRRLPAGVRILKWLFLPPRLGGRRPRLTAWATRIALRLLSAR